jgi:hypothetical protein
MNKAALILGLLMVLAIFGGCTAKKAGPPQQTAAPSGGGIPTIAEEETIPDVTVISEEELIEEPDFDMDETVNLGDLL